MSKGFFEIFSKFNPLEKEEKISHKHSYIRIGGAEDFHCKCGEEVTADAVYEYGLSKDQVKSEKEQILEMIDEMLLDPPMRGDVALSWLRLKIQEKE